jgi:hypothetical protein
VKVLRFVVRQYLDERPWDEVRWKDHRVQSNSAWADERQGAAEWGVQMR